MAVLSVVISIVLLILLISWLKLHPFLAFLISAILASVLLGLPLDSIAPTLQAGMGNLLGPLSVIICVGAMFGKLVCESGAAQQIGNSLMALFGQKYLTLALMFTGFIVGIPLFYNVGFVILIPLVFSIAYQTKLPAVYLGIPLLAALSVTHGFLPPHPSPTALVPQFGADMGLTLVYGLIVALPTMLIAGPFFSRFLKDINATPLKTFVPEDKPQEALPGTLNSFLTSLLPVLLLALTAGLPHLSDSETSSPLLGFVGHPMVVMLLSLLLAMFTLGKPSGLSMSKMLDGFSDAIKDVAVILLIIAGAGALKQVFVVSGVSQDIGTIFSSLAINPLLLGWLMATIIRICLGSATVAGLTAASILAPMAAQLDVDPNLMVLAIGAGSLMCSHVNDSGFWMFKEYFNLDLKQTFMSWTMMETLVGVVGLFMILTLNLII
ncbi:GntP family permease [Neptunicella marina]|uniref:Gluconate transporter n=1 Tax=Neptunicella marina TaxID=2125989 RepID=A0A8J6ITB0_9ALTE|nr:gluconate:H+ symporter [Neptunicella marina]MBC3765228.1 gluconate transporter [Neptunicella marina]